MIKKLFLMVTLSLAIIAGLAGPAVAAQPPELLKVLIGFNRQPGPAEQALVRNAGGTIKYTYHLVPAIAASISEAAIQGLLRNPTVTSIEPDIAVYAIDAELDDAWGVKRIGAGTVHDGGNKGAGVKVAIIDSGIDNNHPDLVVVGGKDFVNGDDDPMDDNGHGTHVAGTVAAKDNDFGVVGVAPLADLYALKVLSASGSGSYSDVIAALEWAVLNGIQVTNNSYGSSGYPGDLVKLAFDTSYAAGVLHVAAAGNSGNCGGRGDKVIYPARWDSVIAVGATNASDGSPCFSSPGPAVELGAPGVAINSTLLGGGYGEKNGTSMASPHVAGTAALVIASGITDANGNGWINDDVRLRLQNTAEDIGLPATWVGYGLVDAEAASAAPDAEPPVISGASGDTSGTTGEPVAISATITDNVGVVGAAVHYTPIDGSETTVAMTEGDANLWSADVPVAEDKVGAITYYITAQDAGGNTDREPAVESYDITVTDNDAPIARAGPDQTVLVGDTVAFDGSASSDNIGITSYSWDFDASDGSDVDADATGVTVSHVYATAGTYFVTLTVDDAAGNGPDSDILTVTVTLADTEAPTAVAGPNQTVVVGDTVAFDGSASSDNISITSYSWDFDASDGIPVDATTVTASHVYATAGTYIVTLTVDDAAGNGPVSDTLTVTVNAAPEPTIDVTISRFTARDVRKGQYSITAQVKNEDAAAQVTITARLVILNSDGDVVDVLLPDQEVIIGPGGKVNIKWNDTTELSPGTYTAKVTILEEPGQEATDTFDIK